MPIRPQKTRPPGRPKGSRSFDASIAKSFGAVMRSTRLAAGISQEHLAHTADIERSYIGRIERGQSQPTLHALLKIALALDCEVADLVAPVEVNWRSRG